MRNLSEYVREWRRDLPARLEGPLPLPEGENAAARVERFLAQHARFFFGTAAPDLRLERRQESPGGLHFYFQQFHQELPVLGARVAVHLDAGGERLLLLTSGFRPDIPADDRWRAQVSQQRARDIGVSAMGGPENLRGQPTMELGIWPRNQRYELVWRVICPAFTPPADWQFYIDAHTGSILEQRDILLTANPGHGAGDPRPAGPEHRALVFRPNPIVSSGEPQLFSEYLATGNGRIAAQRTAVRLQDLAPPRDGAWRLEGPIIRIVDRFEPHFPPPESADGNFLYPPGTPEFAATMVYYWVDNTQRYIQSLGFREIVTQPLEADPHDGVHPGGAYFSTWNYSLGFGATMDRRRPPAAEDAEVILHEYGHAVQQGQVPGFGLVEAAREARAMGEGWGDILAVVYFAHRKPEGQRAALAQWLAGPQGLRRVDADLRYPADMVGEPHHDGQIWSRALWDLYLALGGDAAEEVEQIRARDTLLRLVLQSHQYLEHDSGFHEGARALLLADRVLYDGRHADLIRRSVAGRGIPVAGAPPGPPREAEPVGGVVPARVPAATVQGMLAAAARFVRVNDELVAALSRLAPAADGAEVAALARHQAELRPAAATWADSSRITVEQPREWREAVAELLDRAEQLTVLLESAVLLAPAGAELRRAAEHGARCAREQAALLARLQARLQAPVAPLADLWVADGYVAERYLTDLTYPSALTWDDRGRLFIAEGGFAYPAARAVARILAVLPGGRTREIARDFRGPITSITWHRGFFYVCEGQAPARVLRVSDDGQFRHVLIDGLHTGGQHFTTDLAIGPDGKMYFGVGTATNSAVVSPDDMFRGMRPRMSDVPARDYVLRGINFTTPDPEHPGRTITTGAFHPFGEPSRPGEVVQGQLLSNGVIYRANLDGTGLEVYADGFRNPFGLAFDDRGRLWAADHGMDDRSSRPVGQDWDPIWEVRRGGWYGWPDYASGLPVTHPRFNPQRGEQPDFLLAQHPPLAGQPVARLVPHGCPTKFAWAPNGPFGHRGQMFVPLIGDMAPRTAPLAEHTGYRVVRVNPAAGQVRNLLINRRPGEEPAGAPHRPIAVTFDPGGEVLYLLDFGLMQVVPMAIMPKAGSGALWRIRRDPLAGQG